MRLTSAISPRSISFATGVAVVAAVGLAPLFGWALAEEQWLIFAGLGLVALTPVFIRWPVVCTLGVYALLVSSLDSLPLFQGAATLSRPAGAVAGAVLVVAGLMERRLVRPPAPALWWGMFLLWGILSASWAIDAELSLSRLPTILSLFFLYMVAVSFRPTPKEFYWVCALTVIGGAMAGSIGYFFGVGEAVGIRGRVAIGEFDSNPNSLGRMLILPFALAVAAFVGLRGATKRAIAVGCLGLIGVGMYISMSRAAVLSMIVVMAVLLYRIKARMQIIVAAVVLFGLTAAVPEKFFDRLGRVMTGEDATGSGRTEIWQVGLESIGDYWLFGAGLLNFPRLSGGSGAHNSIVMVALELGVVGLVLMFAAVGGHLLAVHRVMKTGRPPLPLAALEAASFGMLVGAMFADRIWSKTFWLTWTLLVWAVRLATTQSLENPASNRRGSGIVAPDQPIQDHSSGRL